MLVGGGKLEGVGMGGVSLTPLIGLGEKELRGIGTALGEGMGERLGEEVG